MIYSIFARHLWLFGLSLVALISVSADAQEEFLSKRPPPGSAAPAGIFPQTQSGAILLNPANNSKEIQPNTMLLNPANGFRKFRQVAAQFKGTSTGVPAGVSSSGETKTMTMLTISCYELNKREAAQHLLIPCRTEGYISNAEQSRVVLKGVVTEDVVSAGKILIAAGSKVAGIVHVDPDSGRFESEGNWSIIAENEELRVQAEVQDANGGFHGIAGKETSFESELTQRQAVARDGGYCFLADKTPFVLSLTGKVNITELKAVKSSQ